MPTSTFEAEYHHTSQVTRQLNDLNITSGETVLQIGDPVKNVVTEDRHGIITHWDLGNPNIGLAIPKDAIIDDARWEFVPSATQTTTNQLNEFHRMALIASNGYWDRSKKHSLHLQQTSTLNYSPPNITTTYDFRLKDTDDVQIADTMPTDTGWATSTSLFAAWGSAGSTIEVPADKDVGTVSMNLVKFSTHGTDKELVMNVYSLHRNGRQYAIDDLIATSLPIMYNSLTTSASATVEVDFTLINPLPAQDTARWIGVMLEGEWFTGFNTVTHQIRWKSRRMSAIDDDYLAGTAGSGFTATSDPSLSAYENAWDWRYMFGLDAPYIYINNFAAIASDPFPRYFGSIMGNDSCDPWTIDVARSYGSTTSGASVIFNDVVQNVQDWIDSEWYEVESGRTTIGMMLEGYYPDGAMWEMYGPGNVAGKPNMKLIIDWSLPAHDQVCSFGLLTHAVVTSGPLGVTNTVSSFPVIVQGTVFQLGSEISGTVGHYGVDVSSAVMSSPLTVGEC